MEDLASTYEVLKRTIPRPGGNKERIRIKLDAFFLFDSITQAEFEELVTLLNQQP